MKRINLILAAALAGSSSFVFAIVPDASNLGPRDSSEGPPSYFNVRDYGAKADGIADDAKAISSAVAAAKSIHGTVIFPPGVYAVNSAMNFTGLYQVAFLGTGGGPADNNLPMTSVLKYMGPAGVPAAFDFSGATYVRIENLAFTNGSNLPDAEVLIARTTNAGFGESILFEHDTIEFGRVASLADYSAEVVNIVDCYINTISRGLLLTGMKNNYGLTSAFATLAASGSMTQVNMRGGKIVGHGTNVELDGRGSVVSDLNFFGVYYSNAGDNATVFRCWGQVHNVVIEGARDEVESNGINQTFIKAEEGTAIRSWTVHGLDQTQGYTLFSNATRNFPAVLDADIAGMSASVLWSGSLSGVSILDSSWVNVTVTNGNILYCRFTSWNGVSKFSYTGDLLADINQYKNVVAYKSLFQRGSVSYTVNRSGHFVATYGFDLCSFDASHTPQLTNISSANYVNAQAVFGNAGYGKIACPAGGSSPTETVTATYQAAGDTFVVRLQ